MTKPKTTPLMRQRAKERAAILAKYPVETVRLKDCPDPVREHGETETCDEAKKVGPLYVLVLHDESPGNPREDSDCHVGTIIGTNDREAVCSDGKRVGTARVSQQRSRGWIAEHVNTDPDVYCYATLERNDRMGNVSIGGLRDPAKDRLDPDADYFDGVIVAYRQDVKEAFAPKSGRMPARRRVYASLKSEVGEYSQWCTGNVYGYYVVDEDGKHQDSCWGFIGPYGDYGEYAMEEGVSAAVWCVEDYVKKHSLLQKAWEERRVMLRDALQTLDPDNDPARDMRDDMIVSLNKAKFEKGWTL